MINKKNLWFLTLFSLVLVLSVYYITMPKELLLTNNDVNNEETNKVDITETSIVETLRIEDNATTLEEINKLKATISDNTITSDAKNEAFDALKLLNQISSKEELLEEKVKNTLNLDSFIKIDGDQIRVVVESDEHNENLANNIMRTIQANFDTKQYISIQFKLICMRLINNEYRNLKNFKNALKEIIDIIFKKVNMTKHIILL